MVPKEDGDDENPPTLFEQYQRCFKSSINDDASSVYVKGFLGDAAAGDKKNVGQISLEQFFKPYGSVSDHLIKYVDDAGMWLAEVSPNKSSQGIWIRTQHGAVTFVRWWNQVKSGHQIPNEIIPVAGAVASREVPREETKQVKEWHGRFSKLKEVERHEVEEMLDYAGTDVIVQGKNTIIVLVLWGKQSS